MRSEKLTEWIETQLNHRDRSFHGGVNVELERKARAANLDTKYSRGQVKSTMFQTKQQKAKDPTVNLVGRVKTNSSIDTTLILSEQLF